MASSTTQTTLPSSNRSGRLKYANAQDLPSFPSTGLKNDGAAASAAATLGWANQKSPELWKPDTISKSASTAALLANDTVAMVTDSRRGQSSAGSQAAVMAASSARSRQDNQPSPPSLWGSSAANLAFKASLSPKQSSPTLGTSTLTRQGSMRAARGAMAGVRPRSISSPQPPRECYPDQANAASNALSAATIAHRPSMRTMNIPIEDAGAVPYTTMNRQMFTSHPPVKPETDEQRRNDVLHASAVAMARRMYNQQEQNKANQTQSRERASSFNRHGGEGNSSGLTEQEPIPIVYGNLQEAAYRLAQQRLAKLQDEHQKNRDLQEYYGAAGPLQHRQSKLGTIRDKLTRRRSSSDGDLMLEDQRRSRQIRNQMSLFNTKLVEVDEQKRTRDREALLAAAQRNVQAQLKDMDDKIYADSGLVASSLSTKQGDWEGKAQAAAQARFDAAHGRNYGKIDLGGGKFMDREEVDKIAAKNVQPLLDEINKNAEREYERKMQQKVEEEKQREEEEKKKAREREIQASYKKLKDQQKDEEKMRKAELKQLEKEQKERARAAKADQKRLGRDGKQKEKERDKDVVVVVPVVGANSGGASPEKEPEENKTPEQGLGKGKERQREEEEVGDKPEASNRTSTGGLTRALSIKFNKGHLVKHKRRESKGKEAAITAPAPVTDEEPLDKEAAADHRAESPSSPTSKNKVKTWFKSHFRNRSRSKSNLSGGEEDNATSPKSPKDKISGGGFIGGAALARLSQGSSSSSPSGGGSGTGKPSSDGSESRRNSMREVASAGRTTITGEKGEEVGETSWAGTKTGVRDGAVLSPTPIPIPMSPPTFAPRSKTTQSEPPLEGVYDTGIAIATARPVNVDGVSISSPESEEREPEYTLKPAELSAVEKFGTTDWDTSLPASSSSGTAQKARRTAESVSSLSSNDLSGEDDSSDDDDDDDGEVSRSSLERFEAARGELERPREPPRVSGESSILGRPRPIPRDYTDGIGNTVGVGMVRESRDQRAASPYRGSRFSEHFDEDVMVVV